MKILANVKYVFGCAAFLLFASVSYASPAQELADLLVKHSNMRADFVQTIKLGNSGVTQTTSGWMALSRPGKFHWEILKPIRQTIIADGKYLWVYDADLEQATRFKMDYKSNSPALLLTSSMEDLQKDFTITKEESTDNKIIFKLVPKSEQLFQSTKLEFVDNELRAMDIVDNLNQHMRIDFSNVTTDADLTDGTFIFNPPAGTDLLLN